MISPDKIVCLIPLRGGSKSIPRKNIIDFKGKPLAVWVVEAALACRDIDEVWISTDCDEIRAVVANHCPTVSFCLRAPETATDEASTESVMLDFMEQVDFDVLVTAQATSPFTTSNDFSQALRQFYRDSADSLLTGVRQYRFYWTEEGVPLNYDPALRPRRQDFAGSIVENGAFYLTKKRILRAEKCRLGGKVSVYVMEDHTFDEVDEIDDLARMKEVKSAVVPKWSEVKMIICDVDGTLTDAGMYYDGNGDVMRKFNTRDAQGLARLRSIGVEVLWLSAEDSAITRARAKKLGIDCCYVGISDKRSFLEKLALSRSIDLRTVCYIGDDLGDLEVMKLCGVTACPGDAVSEIKSISHYISELSGGHGAVREVADQVYASK